MVHNNNLFGLLLLNLYYCMKYTQHFKTFLENIERAESNAIGQSARNLPEMLWKWLPFSKPPREILWGNWSFSGPFWQYMSFQSTNSCQACHLSTMWWLCCAPGVPIETHVHSDIFHNSSWVFTTWSLVSSTAISRSFITKILLPLAWTISLYKKFCIFWHKHTLLMIRFHFNMKSTLNQPNCIQIKLALQWAGKQLNPNKIIWDIFLFLCMCMYVFLQVCMHMHMHMWVIKCRGQLSTYIIFLHNTSKWMARADGNRSTGKRGRWISG